ncbi:hypothetical protein LTR53_017468 [Teratosphaeriaceae sp. CCFEE 6253]|nr:hypothetical protein LTR53_017468 [Teratosphaeriaceae sp. CCFEE 6253]
MDERRSGTDCAMGLWGDRPQSPAAARRAAAAEPHWRHYGGSDWRRRRPKPATAPSASSLTSTTSKTTVAQPYDASKSSSSTPSASSSGALSSSSSATTASVAPTATGTASVGGVAYHKIWRQLQQEFTEEGQQASWGYWYYAVCPHEPGVTSSALARASLTVRETQDVEGLTHQSGPDTSVRGQFTTHGVLNNTEDTRFRAINDDYPVFAYAVDLGSVGSESVESVFTINLAQGNAVQFNGANGVQPLPSYWTSPYSDDLSALSFFYNDYDHVSGICTDLDNRIAADTKAVSDDYLTLTSLTTRQAFNAITVVGDSSEPFVFLKEISSNGDMQTTKVDVIFPAMPIFLYTNPTLLKLLLDPIFIYTAAGHFTQGANALHDLGKFPNATAAGDESQPVEECGNMLIMTLAYVQRSGDMAYLDPTKYDILKQWAEFLVNDSLVPANQISTDDFAGALANQTNLALKGMVGIQAFAMIANMTGHAADGANFSSIAREYIAQWQTLGIAHEASPPHATLAYGMNETHGLLYNLYADALLETRLVPREVYRMQSDFYPTVADKYGVPLDTRHNYTKNDWEMCVSAPPSPP